MSYSAKVTENYFEIKKENIDNVLKNLSVAEEMEYFYKYTFHSRESVQKTIAEGTDAEKRRLLERFFEEYNYELDFDEESNIIGLFRHGGNYDNDEIFFDIFADYVEKGSYIQFEGEDGNLWRLVIKNGECYEVNPTIIWPNEVNNQDKYTVAKEVELENLINELELADYDISGYSDQQLMVLLDNIENELASNDLYNDIYHNAMHKAFAEFENSLKNEGLDTMIKSGNVKRDMQDLSAQEMKAPERI